MYVHSNFLSFCHIIDIVIAVFIFTFLSIRNEGSSGVSIAVSGDYTQKKELLAFFCMWLVRLYFRLLDLGVEMGWGWGWLYVHLLFLFFLFVFFALLCN